MERRMRHRVIRAKVERWLGSERRTMGGCAATAGFSTTSRRLSYATSLASAAVQIESMALSSSLSSSQGSQHIGCSTLRSSCLRSASAFSRPTSALSASEALASSPSFASCQACQVEAAAFSAVFSSACSFLREKEIFRSQTRKARACAAVSSRDYDDVRSQQADARRVLLVRLSRHGT